MPRSVEPEQPPTSGQKRRARTILKRLKERYPDIGTALAYGDSFQLIVATVMSARSKPALPLGKNIAKAKLKLSKT